MYWSVAQKQGWLDLKLLWFQSIEYKLFWQSLDEAKNSPFTLIDPLLITQSFPVLT